MKNIIKEIEKKGFIEYYDIKEGYFFDHFRNINKSISENYLYLIKDYLEFEKTNKKELYDLIIKKDIYVFLDRDTVILFKNKEELIKFIDKSNRLKYSIKEFINIYNEYINSIN